MRPILKYPGAKWRLADWIISHMPPHESYLEPYLGSGAVFFCKPPARIETVNDIDGDVVNFFRVCRDKPDLLAYALSLTPWSREEFINARVRDDVSDVEQARCFAIRCWMAFGASASSTSWRHSTGCKKRDGPDNPKLWAALPDTVIQVANRLRNAQIESCPAVELIKRLNSEQVLIYADPPYVKSTRTAHRNQYAYEMSDHEHIELLQVLKSHKGMVLLSGYDCEMYRDMLPDWYIVATNTTAEKAAKRTECLWLNPAAEYSAVGQIRLEG